MDPSNAGRAMDPKVYRALIKADISSLKTILRESPRCMDGVTVTGNTALHIAAELDYNWSIPEIHEIFNSHMHFQFATNSRGDTPLHCAVRAGKNFMANFLIGSARKSNGRLHLHEMQNEHGDTPLHVAARKGHSHIAFELMKADALLAEAINKHGESAVYLAAESEAVEIVRILLKFPTCAFEGPNGQTALHAAVCRNYGMLIFLPFNELGCTQV